MPGILLVHGGGANSSWWDHVAPFGAGALDRGARHERARRQRPPRHVLDAGLGEGGDVRVRAGGIDGKPFVVGHSPGGWVTSQIAVDFGDELAGIMIIDSPLNDEPPEIRPMQERARSANKHHGPRKSTLEIVAHFRHNPHSTSCCRTWRNITEQSVHEVDGNWVWKFDRGIFTHTSMVVSNSVTGCRRWSPPPTYAANTASFPTDGRRHQRTPRPPGADGGTPDSGHHPMLDRP